MALPNTPPESPAPAASLEVEGYCVKCKGKRKMNEAQIVPTQNGRKAAKGKCPVCGTTMTKFISSKEAA